MGIEFAEIGSRRHLRYPHLPVFLLLFAMQKLTLLFQLLNRFDQFAADWGAALLGLWLRCYVAWQFMKAGIAKVSNWDGTLDLFRDEYQVPFLPPELAAVMGAAGELTLPVLLFVGLFSRPAALALLGVNIMAVVSYPQLFSLSCPAAINDHFFWGVMLLVVASFGPGKIALDTWLARKFQTA